MNRHVSHKEMDAFCAGTLPGEEPFLLGEHIETCPSCDELFKKFSADDKYFSPLILDLSPAMSLKNYHFNIEKLVSYVDEQMDGEQREMLDCHMQGCGRCREDLRHFREYRRLEDEADPEGT